MVLHQQSWQLRIVILQVPRIPNRLSSRTRFPSTSSTPLASHSPASELPGSMRSRQGMQYSGPTWSLATRLFRSMTCGHAFRLSGVTEVFAEASLLKSLTPLSEVQFLDVLSQCCARTFDHRRAQGFSTLLSTSRPGPCVAGDGGL